MTQVGKINFKIRPPTALTANFVYFPGFFTHWGAESILETTIYLKSATNVRLVAAARRSQPCRFTGTLYREICGEIYGGFSGLKKIIIVIIASAIIASYYKYICVFEGY